MKKKKTHLGPATILKRVNAVADGKAKTARSLVKIPKPNKPVRGKTTLADIEVRLDASFLIFLTTAAELTEAYTKEFRKANTVRGKWSSKEAKVDYDKMRLLATLFKEGAAGVEEAIASK